MAKAKKESDEIEYWDCGDSADAVSLAFKSIIDTNVGLALKDYIENDGHIMVSMDDRKQNFVVEFWCGPNSEFSKTDLLTHVLMSYGQYVDDDPKQAMKMIELLKKAAEFYEQIIAESK